MGYALSPPTKPSLYELCRVDELVNSIIADVRDFDTLSKAMVEAKPEIVIHMAAQPLVRDSYVQRGTMQFILLAVCSVIVIILLRVMTG